jgi:hypothetical protein
MAAQYYVWYRMTGDPREAAAVVAALQANVAQRTGVTGRLLRRRDDASLWMEIYEAVDDTVAFARALEAAGRAVDIERFAIDGVRHVEAFVAQDA